VNGISDDSEHLHFRSAAGAALGGKLNFLLTLQVELAYIEKTDTATIFDFTDF
jgi:hypothetical protein